MFMTVIDEDNNSCTCINLHDVDYIVSENRKIIYHIGSKKYTQISNMTELLQGLPEFDLLDRSNLVNLNKIRKFDRDYGKVFFESTPDNYSKYANVAKIKYRFVEEMVNRTIEENNDRPIETENSQHQESYQFFSKIQSENI